MVNFLSKTRFGPEANNVFKMPTTDFEQIADMGSSQFIDKVNDFITTFQSQQLPRLAELKRYYLADNNIKYRDTGRDSNRADNRIASDWAKYITVFMQGYMLGNPIQYEGDDNLVKKIAEFSQQNGADYHDGLLETDLSIYGRAYELVYSNANAQERVTKLEPEQTFVVYDDTIAADSMFGVRFYQIRFNKTDVRSYVEIYTADKIYYYQSNSSLFSGVKLVNEATHQYGAVPINEYKNNEERLGDFESVLDSIDAYDLSQSELANFQQDMNDAYLVLIGNPVTGTAEPEYATNADGELVLDDYGKPIPSENSSTDVFNDMLKARMLIMDNNNDPDGPKPNAFYLTKEYDTTGAEAYKTRLVDDILRFTFTPDTNDQNFAGTQSGEAMKYKLMGNDNLRKTKERLLSRGIMRRLRLLGNVWGIKSSVSTTNRQDDLYNAINDIQVNFTPNMPTSDEERLAELKNLFGVVSDETLFTLLSTFTGVDADDEMKRLADENQAGIDNFQAQTGYQTLAPDDGKADE
ncbi:phage portal protein [Leuconostoc gelidum subsp. aenigmaticum]|uniref:phage portal protein n=1 Tax=Leuconostoc gelidum TaxID=1244 RepID=UPI001CC4582E|nr:phage portal protein [Leuconostoc gelidum]MBZ6004086.1 phage portal protein [Leuconostoc gelidum subsp. aenigmaticum]